MKRAKCLYERVFDYVFRDFEDLRLSCMFEDNDVPCNKYIVYKAVPGFVNAYRGVKVLEKTSSDNSAVFMEFTFSREVHDALQKFKRGKSRGVCVLCKNHSRWREVREEIGQEILRRIRVHGCLRYDCAGSLASVAPFLDVKSEEELMVKMEMWETLH